MIIKLDIRDFFGSVRRVTVFTIFSIGYSRRVANMLSDICMLGVGLPQGAPTSPALANLAALGLDIRLSAFAKRHGFEYTRYADDITVSGRGVDQSRRKRTIEAIMLDAGFAPNEAKLRFLGPSMRQSVTGIVVNDKLNWSRDRRRWLRQQIHYLERFGVDDHVSRIGSARAGFKEFIYGHVYALLSVRPDEASEHLAALDFWNGSIR
jgi:RNA-directed DNA polymerase